jgi:hypothetical protein
MIKTKTNPHLNGQGNANNKEIEDKYLEYTRPIVEI